jgi:hypothetical protein
VNFFYGIPFDDYFRYHPPTTSERKRKHDAANALSRSACFNVWAAIDESDMESALDEVQDFGRAICGLFVNSLCLKWADMSLEALVEATANRDKEAVLQLVQQIRMFANQGITLDSLPKAPTPASDPCDPLHVDTPDPAPTPAPTPAPAPSIQYQESPDEFARYLQSQVKAGVTYLMVALHPTLVETTFNFTIHPHEQDGDTADFVVSSASPALIRRIN